MAAPYDRPALWPATHRELKPHEPAVNPLCSCPELPLKGYHSEFTVLYRHHTPPFPRYPCITSSTPHFIEQGLNFEDVKPESEFQGSRLYGRGICIPGTYTTTNQLAMRRRQTL